ncbi:hypothetical protein MANES_16G047151v8 [Manihot esculenta]|uniref:Uncharacterized protein n=1 Tax=Manihot esculenta TaxID=3983 RepID=A0ACB7G732_MANES|nr:hypothetical protein MANES_16G047151v8 [Manihot esculenta]
MEDAWQKLLEHTLRNHNYMPWQQLLDWLSTEEFPHIA